MSYPSTLSSFTDPSPTDRLSTTPHSSIETAQNTGLKEIQAFVGTLSSNVGTLVYDIRGANSNGGGHVQTANKGGTGQTTYTKGDILVATSSSVLTKLAVGADATALLADSTQAAGIKWGGVATTATIQNQTYTYARASIMSGSVYGVVLSQSPSILSDGLGLVVKFPNANTTSLIALSVHTTSSGSVSALIKGPDLANIPTGGITASMIGLVEFDSVSSVFQMTAPLTKNPSTFKNGTAQYAGDTASGTQSIAHGLGVTPKKVRITARKGNGGNNLGLSFSDGSYEGTTNACTYVSCGNPDTGAETTSGVDNTNGVVVTELAGSNNQKAVITFNSTNIVLTWTKTGTPSSANINILWEAQA